MGAGIGQSEEMKKLGEAYLQAAIAVEEKKQEILNNHRDTKRAKLGEYTYTPHVDMHDEKGGFSMRVNLAEASAWKRANNKLEKRRDAIERAFDKHGEEMNVSAGKPRVLGNGEEEYIDVPSGDTRKSYFDVREEAPARKEPGAFKRALSKIFVPASPDQGGYYNAATGGYMPPVVHVQTRLDTQAEQNLKWEKERFIDGLDAEAKRKTTTYKTDAIDTAKPAAEEPHTDSRSQSQGMIDLARANARIDELAAQYPAQQAATTANLNMNDVKVPATEHKSSGLGGNFKGSRR